LEHGSSSRVIPTVPVRSTLPSPRQSPMLQPATPDLPLSINKPLPHSTGARSKTPSTTRNAKKSTTSQQTSTPESVASSRDAVSQPKKRKATQFNYSTDQDKYLAEIFSEEETWALLNGPGEKNSYYANKSTVRGDIARRFNKKFSTDNNPMSIDESQIKNKLTSMQKMWRIGLKIFQATGNG